MKKGITNTLSHPKSSTVGEGWKGNEPTQFAAPVFSVASNDKSPAILEAENLKALRLQKQKNLINRRYRATINQVSRQDENLSLVCYDHLGLD